MKELSRRVMINTDGGALGMTACDSEIVVDDDGKTVYIHAEWVDAAPEQFDIDVTDESIYDLAEQLNGMSVSDSAYTDLVIRMMTIRGKDISGLIGGNPYERYAEYIDTAQQLIIAKLETLQ